MKGITPVIAIILLLLITIAMVGFAFVWFSRVTSGAGQQIEEQTTTQITQGGQVVSIDAVSADEVTIRNIGTVAVDAADIGVFIDGAQNGCGGGTWSGTIAPGGFDVCQFDSVGDCGAGSTIRVSSPGGSDQTTC